MERRSARRGRALGRPSASGVTELPKRQCSAAPERPSAGTPRKPERPRTGVAMELNAKVRLAAETPRGVCAPIGSGATCGRELRQRARTIVPWGSMHGCTGLEHASRRAQLLRGHCPCTSERYLGPVILCPKPMTGPKGWLTPRVRVIERQSGGAQKSAGAVKLRKSPSADIGRPMWRRSAEKHQAPT